MAVDPKGHEYSNLDLIQIEEGLPEESGNAGKLRIRGYSSVTVNLIANGKTEKLRFDGIDIECHGVAIELNATPYRENIAELLRGSWQGISKMVWEEADQKGPMGFSEKNCWDIQPGVLTKDYEFHSPSFPNIWKVKFSQITPQTVQRAVNEASEDKSYHPHLRGYEREMEVWTTDLYLPLHGCKVEIFQAEGWNEFPQFWNQKKVKVIWRNPSKLFGGPQEAE
ncbi:hypothetical protein EON80_08790 [bacterium]|nr:MAG: hypothetical protein EON80_08790 [bacterium]